jgi:RNA polymerase sigma factor (sigma-70 family)
MAISKIITDDELLVKVRQGHEHASEELFARYDLYSWRIAHDFNSNYPNSGIDLNEYHQVAFVSLIKAMEFYDLEFGAFYLYWKAMAWNELLEYFKKNSYITNPAPIGDNSGPIGFPSEDNIGEIDNTLFSRLEMLDIEDLINDIKEKFKEDISKKIINLFLQERSFEEIQKETGVSIRRIYYIINKFKHYFTKLYEKW